MSGSGLTPDDYRRYQEHMKRKAERERRARAEHEKAEHENAEQEKAEQERAEQERAAEERATKQRAAKERATKERVPRQRAAHPANAPPGPDAGVTGFNRIAALWHCLWKYKWHIFYSIVALILAILVKFILEIPIPFPGGTIGGFIWVFATTRWTDRGSAPSVLTPVRTQSCLRDGPVFAVSGQFLRKVAEELDKRTVEGVQFSFDETFLTEVLRADERLATVTRSISDHSYNVCRHISRLDKIVSSKPSWYTPVTRYLPFHYSKETKIHDEAERFLSTLDHAMAARSKMIKQTIAGFESIRTLKEELCHGENKVLKVKSDIFRKMSNLTDTITAWEGSNALWQYVASQFHDIDIAALRSENQTLWERLEAAKDLRLYVAFGCEGSHLSCSEIKKLKMSLKNNQIWSKSAMDDVVKTLDELHGDKIDWKDAGEELSGIMKKYQGEINKGYYERS